MRYLTCPVLTSAKTSETESIELLSGSSWPTVRRSWCSCSCGSPWSCAKSLSAWALPSEPCSRLRRQESIGPESHPRRPGGPAWVCSGQREERNPRLLQCNSPRHQAQGSSVFLQLSRPRTNRPGPLVLFDKRNTSQKHLRQACWSEQSCSRWVELVCCSTTVCRDV